MSLGKLILKRKKAVSPVIATILLIALTVTAAAIVYFVVVPMLKGKAKLAITAHDKVLGSDTQYEITVENIGQAVATFDAHTAFQVVNETDTYNPIAVSVGGIAITYPYELNAGESATFIIELDGIFTSGGTYTVKVVLSGGITAETQAFTY
jgi:flagellin-like protein